MSKYYRNKIEVVSEKQGTIDAGALWERRNNVMHLVDEDYFFICSYDETLFSPVDDDEFIQNKIKRKNI